jgi:monoterpene epsilon-lactone hydrolase
MVSFQGRVLHRAMSWFYGWVFPAGMPVEKLRQRVNSGMAEPVPRGVVWEESLLNGVAGEWIRPPDAPAERVLLYLHGGGYVTKSPAMHRVLVARLAQACGAQAFMADYRLAPEFPFPSALEDATACYRGLLAQGIAPSQIVIAGDSAGGGLAVALLLHLRDAGDPLPAAACLISAWLDCTLSDPEMGQRQKLDPFLREKDLRLWIAHYCAEHSPKNPLISPLWADLHGLPPLLLEVGELEILLGDSLRMAEKAQAAGVEVTLKRWQGMIHVFPLFAGMVPEGKAAIAEMGAFLQKHLAGRTN